MKKIKWYLVLINLVALMVYFNYSVREKEHLLIDGNLVLLQLAPVDPRSLMQGDYMTLRYNLAQDINRDKLEKRGYCVVRLDSNGIAQTVRFQNERTPLHSGEKIIKYTSPNSWSINIGAESYFFEEGQGEKYEKAVYGGLQVDTDGNSILVGLYDNNKIKIE